MEEKKSKKGPESENHLVVILEDMRSKFKAFGEGLTGLREKVDSGFSHMEERLERMGADIRTIKNQIKVKVDITPAFLTNFLLRLARRIQTSRKPSCHRRKKACRSFEIRFNFIYLIPSKIFGIFYDKLFSLFKNHPPSFLFIACQETLTRKHFRVSLNRWKGVRFL